MLKFKFSHQKNSIQFKDDQQKNDSYYELRDSIIVPPTPVETPRNTPSPPPEIHSLPKSEPAPPPKLFNSISVQCDPPPPEITPVVHQPAPSILEPPLRRSEPPVTNLTEQQESKLPAPVKKQSKPDRLDMISKESDDLTDSTQLSSTKDSTTLDSSSKLDEDSDSYFSDGAWLLSKSEGQIIQFDQNGNLFIAKIYTNMHILIF